MAFFTGNIIQAICWTLLHSLWQGLLLAVVTGAVMVASKKASAALRYRLLSAIFVAFIVVTGFTFYIQLHNVQANVAAPLAPVVNNSAPALNQQNNTAYLPAHTGSTIQVYVNNFIEYFNTHASLIVTVWFIIFMARCVKILSGLVYIQRIRHYKTAAAPAFWIEKIEGLASSLHIKRHITLLQSAIVKVPVVVGFLKPTILIPLGLLNNLSQQEVESILIHELAHIRRKDYLFNLVQCFIDVLFFFNPAVLWISALIRSERENCCDDIAINATQNKKQFIQALVSFHQYNSSAATQYAMPFAAGKSKLVNRVKRIVNNHNHTLNPVEKTVLLVCLLAFSITFVTVTNGQGSKVKKPAPNAQAKSNTVVDASGAKAAAKAQKNNRQQHDTVTVATTVDTDNNVVINQTPQPNAEDYIDGLQALGYTKLTVDQLIELKVNGVDAPFIKSFADAGFGHITLQQALNLKIHGVNMAYVNELKSAGAENLTLDKAIGYRNNGITAGFINSFKTAGFNNITVDEALMLRNHGVTAEYINGLKQAGVTGITPEKAMEYRDHGVDANLMNGFSSVGFTGVTVDKAMELRDHGVTPGFITDIRSLGLTNLSLDKAIELRDHGVTADYIKSFAQIGIKNITVDKAIELRNHGVTAGFIERIRKKTGNDFTLDEYIKLKEVF